MPFGAFKINHPVHHVKHPNTKSVTKLETCFIANDDIFLQQKLDQIAFNIYLKNHKNILKIINKINT